MSGRESMSIPQHWPCDVAGLETAKAIATQASAKRMATTWSKEGHRCMGRSGKKLTNPLAAPMTTLGRATLYKRRASMPALEAIACAPDSKLCFSSVPNLKSTWLLKLQASPRSLRVTGTTEVTHRERHTSRGCPTSPTCQTGGHLLIPSAAQNGDVHGDLPLACSDAKQNLE